MAIFDFEDNASIGTVFSVDTATLIVKVEELDKLRKLQVNHLVAIKSWTIFNWNYKSYNS